MAPSSNLMADLAQMANGAASAFGGMREEVDNLIRQRMEQPECAWPCNKV